MPFWRACDLSCTEAATTIFGTNNCIHSIIEFYPSDTYCDSLIRIFLMMTVIGIWVVGFNNGNVFHFSVNASLADQTYCRGFSEMKFLLGPYMLVFFHKHRT